MTMRNEGTAEIETRAVTVIHYIKWLQTDHKWPGLNSVVTVESTREMRDKTEREIRFYITSLTLPASQVGPAIRDHWAVENSLHWSWTWSSATTSAACPQHA